MILCKNGHVYSLKWHYKAKAEDWPKDRPECPQCAEIWERTGVKPEPKKDQEKHE